MKRFVLSLLLPLLVLAAIVPWVAAAPALLFQKTWGGNLNDAASDVAIDSDGSIYTTGSTFSYDPGSPANGSLTLIKYNSTGSILWQKIWSSGPSGGDYGAGVVADSLGDVYVIGSAIHTGIAFLLKFDSQGNPLWQKSWGNSSHGSSASGLALDTEGNIYVAGTAFNLYQTNPALLLKFNSMGSLQWQRVWSYPASINYARGVAVDAAGNIYLPVYSDPCGGSARCAGQWVLLRFNSGGSLLWQKGLYASLDGGIAVDSSGDIYLTGSYNDASLMKVDSSGHTLWLETWALSVRDQGLGVTVDSKGYVYITGRTNNCVYAFGMLSCVADYNRAFLLKFNSSGTLFWQEVWGGTSNSIDYGSSVAVNSNGTAFIAGSVGEDPPYTLTPVKGTLRLWHAVSIDINGTLGTSNLIFNTANGTAQTVTGSESYTGASDLFLVGFACNSSNCNGPGVNPLPPLSLASPVAFITGAITATGLALAKRRWIRAER